MTRFAILALALFGLTACHNGHHGGPSSVRVDGVGEVRYDDHRDGKNYRKCPPGHAKKGWC